MMSPFITHVAGEVPVSRDRRVKVVDELCMQGARDSFEAFTATPINNHELWQQEKAYKACRGPSAKVPQL